MFLEIEHHLALDYDAFVRESYLELRVQPKTTAHQTLLSFVLAAGPPVPVFRYRDWQDNLVHHFGIVKYHDRIAVSSRSLVRTHPAAPAMSDVADPLPLPAAPWTLWDYLQPGGPVRASAALEALLAEAGPMRPTLGAEVRALAAHLHGRFRYERHVTRYDSTTDDVLAAGAGVCQDFAHLLLGLLRRRGIPARYVSGYLHVEPPDGAAAQSHAWVEVHSPTAGWVPYDPTHARDVDERYVAVAQGRHYEDVPPNRGIFRGNARERLTAEVYTRPSAPKDVSTLHEEVASIELPVFQEIPDRRPRRPYTAADEDAAQQQQQQ